MSVILEKYRSTKKDGFLVSVSDVSVGREEGKKLVEEEDIGGEAWRRLEERIHES